MSKLGPGRRNDWPKMTHLVELGQMLATHGMLFAAPEKPIVADTPALCQSSISHVFKIALGDPGDILGSDRGLGRTVTSLAAEAAGKFLRGRICVLAPRDAVNSSVRGSMRPVSQLLRDAQVPACAFLPAASCPGRVAPRAARCEQSLANKAFLDASLQLHATCAA